jgi:hypothetical protein
MPVKVTCHLYGSASIRFLIHFLVLAIGLGVSACDIHHYPNFKGRELKAGDPDYPPVNPHPAQFVQFTAKIPPALSQELSIRYKVGFITFENKDGSLNRYEAPPGCRWKPTDEFYVELPLPVAKSGDTYQARFAIDHFLPGNCGWRFDLILSPILRNPLLWYRSEYNGGLRDQADTRLDTWCTKKSNVHPQIDPAIRDRPDQVNNCASLGSVSGFFIDLPAGFYESIPVHSFGHGWLNAKRA